MSNKTFTKEEVHNVLTDAICGLENCFEDDSYTEDEFVVIRKQIGELEEARRIVDMYLW